MNSSMTGLVHPRSGRGTYGRGAGAREERIFGARLQGPSLFVAQIVITWVAGNVASTSLRRVGNWRGRATGHVIS